MNFITKCISETFPINNLKPSYKPPLINTPSYKLIYLKTENAFFLKVISSPSPPLLPRFMGTSGCTYLDLNFFTPLEFSISFLQ